jgi:hypothetical protein
VIVNLFKNRRSCFEDLKRDNHAVLAAIDSSGYRGKSFVDQLDTGLWHLTGRAHRKPHHAGRLSSNRKPITKERRRHSWVD